VDQNFGGFFQLLDEGQRRPTHLCGGLFLFLRSAVDCGLVVAKSSSGLAKFFNLLSGVFVKLYNSPGSRNWRRLYLIALPELISNVNWLLSNPIDLKGLTGDIWAWATVPHIKGVLHELLVVLGSIMPVQLFLFLGFVRGKIGARCLA
jgi:hypothetical protein